MTSHKGKLVLSRQVTRNGASELYDCDVAEDGKSASCTPIAVKWE